MRRFGWFIIAGAVGFIADAGMLILLFIFSPLGPFAARFFAIFFALCVTWIFNRAVTFGKSRFPLALEGARYATVGLASACLNYAIYAALLIVFPALMPLAALAAASTAAMLFSWTGYSRFVFQK